jgi:quinoprotein dehydrogenase-associated probable ABC transporter substrate-binding protein
VRAGAICVALAAFAVPAHAGPFGLSWFSFAAGTHAGPSAGSDDPASHVLRVCADPDNLPYSRRDGSGFENRIASLMATALHAKLEYVWTPPSRGYVRKTIDAGACDLLVGVPSGFASVLTTRPYYRSAYVFVGRADDPAPLRSFDDARIAEKRIGVQLVGDELASTPPAHALARVGAIDNVVGYTLYGQGPAAERMTDAVADGALDAALVWGPQAGWFAERADVPLRLETAEPPQGMESSFEVSIAMGVRRGPELLRAALDRAIDSQRAAIDSILRDYRVPRVDQPAEVVGRR